MSLEEGETASHASELSILGDGDESVSHCGYCDGKSSGASGRSISYGEAAEEKPAHVWCPGPLSIA